MYPYDLQDVAVTVFHNNSTQVVTSLCGEHASDGVLVAFAIYQLAIMLIIPTIVMGFCYAFVIHALWISRTTLRSLTSKATG